MANSKLIKANEKITEMAVGAFVKIEDKVVSGYTKIEGAIVGRHLTKQEEAIEEAKERLNHKVKP